MKYLCIVYAEPGAHEALGPDESKELDRNSLAYDEKLMADGHFLGAEALQSVSEAVTVRVRNGEMSTTDGPFAETKEHLCGFILIDARDFNEAIRLAGGIPMARIGSVEVRPIYEIAAA